MPMSHRTTTMGIPIEMILISPRILKSVTKAQRFQLRKRNGSFCSSSQEGGDSRDSSIESCASNFNLDDEDITHVRMDNIRTIGKSASFK